MKEIEELFRCILVLLVFVCGHVSAAQYTRPGTTADLTGIWRVLNVDVKSQPSMSAKNNWPRECQFIAFYKDGFSLHQQSKGHNCHNQIPVKRPEKMNTVAWKVDDNAGSVLITRKDYKTVELWKIDRVVKDAHFGSINLIDGDVIMQLIDTKKNKIIWYRIIRKI